MSGPMDATPLDTAGFDADYLPVLRLWMLRALLRCNGVAGFVRENRFAHRSAALLLGFTEEELEAYSEAWALRALAHKLAELEADPPLVPVRPVLARNVARLARRLGLSPVEADILHFAAVQRLQAELGSVLGEVGELSRASVCRLLADCLGHPVRAVQQALDDRGRLCRSALLSVDDARLFTFESKLDLLRGLAESLMLEHDDLLDLFGHSLVRAPGPRLTLADFPHLAEDLRILQPYLHAALADGRPGVNVLLHGRPGTGKTEFVRALATALGAELMEIPSEEPDGRPRAGRDRFESFRFAQSLLAGRRHVLLFDEVEDVFQRGRGEARHGHASGIKGWVNQLLERNAVPTFWVTNEIQALDPAYRRRFDLVIRLDLPPPAVRRSLLDRHLGTLAVPEAWREQVVRHEGVTPALVERAVRVGHTVCSAAPDQPPAATLTRVLNHSLAALGSTPLPEPEPAAGDYRLDLLNADTDLEALCAGLQAVGEARLCLYGPPGTGKTAFGRHLAERLGRPLLVRRASDILSPWVGEAERELASMFDAARRDGAVLLLDEADSFLRDRRGAQRPWEVTLVNEMLTQMEAFRGIFVASTNLADSLDPASLRRFDCRIRLGALRPAQAWRLFGSLCSRLGHDANESLRPAVESLPSVTPGDFAAVARGARLAAPRSAAELLGRLKAMADAKSERSARAIGFFATP